MKKIITIAILVFTMNAFAQVTKLFDFDGTTNGSKPHYTNLIQASDGMLYGMTQTGGASNIGVLFQYNPTANVYTKKFDFAGTTNGSTPYGSLMQASDGMLYGMTSQGGANSAGVLFQYNPATNTYTDKLDFVAVAGSNGRIPLGSLMQASDGMLYGMTEAGGIKDSGVIFQYNPSTSTYTKKIDFAGNTNGGYPVGSLMQASDGMLYGMTQNGGVNNWGTLFQYDPATNTLTKKFDFTDTANGRIPTGSLMQASDGMIYGMTTGGGTIAEGVLFQYNPATNTYTKKLNFGAGAATTGKFGYGTLMQATDGMLYGMTQSGGTSGRGNIFQYNPVTSTYTMEFDFFGGTMGSSTTGTLMQASNGMIYGMANKGGTSTNCTGGCGTLFKYAGAAAGINQVTSNNVQVTIYPNPNNGSFVIETNIAEKQTVNVYDVNGKIVLSQNINGKTTIDASTLNEGVYNISIISNEGVVNKRVVIVK
ncbi:MAG TPA: choice-of-anchor tandem repeat GloVer-containing protein [Bacteroidia bacterium]